MRLGETNTLIAKSRGRMRRHHVSYSGRFISEHGHNVNYNVTACELAVCGMFGRRQYERQYSQPSRQQTIQRPMTAKMAAVTPKLLPSTTAAVYTDDVNDYTRGGCAVHRPLPSLPRRMDGSWAKSVRSDASGSDASLHWDIPDDDVDELSSQPVHPRTVRCRSVAAATGRDVDGDDDGRRRQSVRDVPGCRTMPRPPGAPCGAARVVSDVDRQRLLVAQQLQQQLRPIDSADARPYANISDHSVDV